MGNNTAESKIEAAREQLQSEYNSLQILGRALMPDEQARSSALGNAVEALDAALKALSKSTEISAREREASAGSGS